MNNNEMICIVCPMGCHMNVSKNGDGINIEGNQCDRGRKYATDELTNPLRTVTSTVKITGSSISRLPVKTENPIPKDKMFELMRILKKVEVRSPIKTGDIILNNVLSTGVNIISTKTL
jgi:CxxC motif-containing protein